MSVDGLGLARKGLFRLKYDNISLSVGSTLTAVRQGANVSSYIFVERAITSEAEGGGVLIIMHGRGRITTDPRIPTMPGRSTSGFHRPGRHC